jgi:4'-phosphopantetheinyl transferase
MCAFGGEPVGLDLQQHQNCARERIAKRFFHPAENAFLQSSGYDAFFDVWAAKESFLKYTGEGMRRPLSGFSVVSGEALSSGTEERGCVFSLSAGLQPLSLRCRDRRRAPRP